MMHMRSEFVLSFIPSLASWTCLLMAVASPARAQSPFVIQSQPNLDAGNVSPTIKNIDIWFSKDILPQDGLSTDKLLSEILLQKASVVRPPVQCGEQVFDLGVPVVPVDRSTNGNHVRLTIPPNVTLSPNATYVILMG